MTQNAIEIIKRDGSTATFDENKVIIAVGKAMMEVDNKIDEACAAKIANKVRLRALKSKQLNNPLTVEEIQDIVELELMKEYPTVAKAYILYRNERNKTRNQIWDMTELQRDIYENKYKHENETFDEFIYRVSGGNKAIGNLIRKQDFLYAGRILAGRGLERNVTLSNCYVLPSPEDNIESIFDTAKYMARTYSYGGGVGTDLSNLRPAGARVNNAALTTSGAVSFMDLYDVTTAVIGQKGRRGALMLSMSTDHPDIESFIDSKKDVNKITHANISIRTNDKFFTNLDKNGKILSKLAQNNWESAEPGILFWDRVEDWHLLSKHPEYKLYSTNPCFTGDMELLTKDGYRRFDELNGHDVEVVNIDGDVSQGKVWATGVKTVNAIRLSNNKIIKSTPDHVFQTLDGSSVEAKDLKGKKLMPLLNEYKKYDKEFIKYGFIQGDGGLTRLASDEHLGLEVHIGQDDSDIRELFKDSQHTKGSRERSIYLQGNYKNTLKKLGFSSNVLPERTFPSTYQDWTLLEKASFLQGCYSANGSVITNHRVSYKTTCKEFAEQLLETLDEDFGITAYITTNKTKDVEFDNGVYTCKESYDINISRYDSIQTFFREINFYHNYKKEALVALLKHKAPTVTSVKVIGEEMVYDFHEPLQHWGVVEGFIAHNCGEQPLPGGGSCLLGSINLSNFVLYPYTDDAQVDKVRLANVVKEVTIGMNEVLDDGIPLHPLAIQREVATKFRQVGIGIMGLADLFIKMGVRYGSEESLELSHMLGQLIRDNAIMQSVELAKRYGAYPAFDIAYIQDSDYYKALPQYIQDAIAEHGMRNSHVLSIAPTGSISTMTGVSGGIEPIFANSFLRTTKSLSGQGDVKYKVYTQVIEELMQAQDVVDEKDLPEYCVTSHDIAPIDRIKLQSVWQHYVDSAISSTINLHEDTTAKEIEEIYIEAWKHGLKGVTVYRDNCFRTGILEVEDDEPSKFECPECGHDLNMAEGCNSCPECGWGQCSI